MCGFIGVLGPEGKSVIGEVYDGLIAIQHRGQDAAGAITYDERFHVRRSGGLVRDVFRQSDMERLTGHMGIGHVRYPTIGDGGADDAQPFMVTAPFGIAMAHNGNLTNFESLKKDLVKNDHRHVDSNCDVEAILQVFASSLSRHVAEGAALDDEAVYAAVQEVYERAKGAYSVVAMIAGYGMVGFRDPFGIKPIIMGERDGPWGTSYCIASESVLLDVIDYHRTQSLAAGEVVIVHNDGSIARKVLGDKPHRPCVFEWVYFARPDSFLDRVSVYKTRLRAGEKLAEKWRETGLHADVIIPVPESARDAAIAMARELDIKCRDGLVKNRYIGRTFIMPDNVKRRKSIRHKLNTIQLEFEGKDVLLVDDSIVRGNTSKQIVQMARDAGARKVYFASYSPPLRHPCVYGIDMSTKNEFVAKDRDEAAIAKELGADFVVYQTLDDLESCVREGNEDLTGFCNACFSGDYPTGDVTPEVLQAIETERLHVDADR